LAHRYRRVIVVGLHLGLVVLCNYLAFLLRFENAIPDRHHRLFLQLLPWLVVIRGVLFIPFRLYQGVWRYTSIWDVRNVIGSVLCSTAAFYLLVRYGLGVTGYSRSVLITDAILLICFMSLVRLTRRLYREIWPRGSNKRVLIYGAGDAGAMIVREMKNSDQAQYEPIGFIDDDALRVGRRIHGVPVLGTRADVRRILTEQKPEELLIAIPRANAVTMHGIVKALEPFKIRLKTLPTLHEILEGRVSVSQIRNLAPEDLLSRAPVGLDPAPIRGLVEGRRVMITGAGGSIGSELSRQIARLNPESLVLFERYENNLFAIVNDLGDSGLAAGVIPAVGDVTDLARLDAVLGMHRPEIIFHAAAHKHVPLMEQNPCEAVKNNVIGTRLLAEAAERHRADRFILVSTDKAVNPTTVMGASKRVAELVLATRAAGSPTSFVTVRFGNVLASNGSVVPRFREQIRRGGPVTVTHPEIRRYFMSIAEAVQLVLHAAATGDRGEIWVLKMGDPVKLIDMARTLIRLEGFVPDEEIRISFIGLRPSEKLREELVGRDEIVEESPIDTLFRVRQCQVPIASDLAKAVAELEQTALGGRTTDVLRRLKAIVPEFRHGENGDALDRPAVERIPVAEPSHASITSSRRVCPVCAAADIHRSRTRTMVERVQRSLREERLFRCHACNWRGWLVPVEHMEADETAELAGPDLVSLDEALREDESESRPVQT
jgi:FlaA1/EpsC-like NDP-sugar epimerase